jgi:hypothetical protein
MTGWGSDIKAYEMETPDNHVCDWEVEEWEHDEDEILLYVCSECGLIASKLVQHGECGLQDWWHLNVKCYKKENSK